MSRINNSRKNSSLSCLPLTILLFAALLNVFATIGRASVSNGEGAREKQIVFGTSNLQSILSGDVFLDHAFFVLDDATFIVNNNGDTNDILVGDGICADSAGNCTLRAAIQEANATAGTDQINFALTTPAAIQLNSSLTPASLTISEGVTITGPGAQLLTVNGNANTLSGVFNVNYAGTATTTISNITVANSGRDGINNDARLNLSEVTVKGNRYGIYGSGRLTISRATISNNSGGGVYLNDSPSATITNSIINDNNGSGIYLTSGSAGVNVSNTTITNNTSSGNGGGINSLSGDLTLNNVTVSHNTAATSGGGLYYNAALAGVSVRNTLIANNNAPTGPDIATGGGSFVSRGNNLIGKNAANIGFVNGVNGDKVGTLATPIDPLLGALQNNGGNILTRALLVGSPARDAGNICVTNSTCVLNNPASALSTDQRGANFPRLFESSVDIGAFESFYPVASIASVSPSNWGTGRGAFELTVNGTNFVAASIVRWNGQNRATTFVSNTQIKAQITAADVAAAGQYAITILNPQPGGGVSDPFSFTVADCSYSINPASQNAGAAGLNGSINVTTQFGCAWTAAVNPANPWLTINSSGGTGPATISFSVAPNNGPARSGTAIIAGQTFTVNQANGCTYALMPTSTNIGAAGGAGSFAVTTSNTGCTWTATTADSWIGFSGGTSGNGNGTVNFTVAANTSPARTGKITVNGQDFTITQNNGCAYALSPTSATIAAAGGASSFGVAAGAGCAWTAVVNSPSWITINSGSSGSGNGTVNFTVAANNGPARSATITVNGQTFTVNQNDGCTYVISPTSQGFTAAGGSGSVAVTSSNASCTWTAAVNGNNPWITVTSGSSGSGNGTVNYTVAANTGPARSGTITIAGHTFTVNQVTGCTYSISPSSVNISEAGGSKTFNVAVNNQSCGWTATVNNASWITIPSGAAGTGNGTVSLAIAVNAGAADRIGTIAVTGGQTFTVNQLNLKVTNLNDGGAGSLRQAVANANLVASDDTITVSSSVAGILTLTSGEIVVSNNGALEIKGSGADRLLISGGNASRMFYLNNTNVTISDVALLNGNGVGLESTTTNKAGGAIYVNSGTLKLNRVLVSTNTLSVPGGLGNSSNGGGVYYAGGTNHLIQNSTFYNNKCLVGGGLFNLNGNLTIVNSTFTGNVADVEGGAIYSAGNTLIRNSTITRNRTLVALNSGAGVVMWGGVINFNNSIIAGNFGPEISINSGEVYSTGFNLIGDEAGDAANTTNSIPYQPSDKLDTPPMLGVLDNYGGAIVTHALLRGSPAINAGNNANALPTDMRGSPRIVSETIDIGAFEHNINPMPETLPAGAVGTYYSLMLSASRINGTNPTETFTFSVIEGLLPNGLSLTTEGLLQGTPTSSTSAPFTVRAIGEDGMAGAVRYTISLGCTYSLNPTNQPFPSTGGNGTINVNVSPGCSWNAVSSAPAWVRVTGGASGTGNGTVQFVVDPNTGPARNATITIAGQSFNVSQANGCAYSLSQSSATAPATGGTGSFNINVGAGCTWAASSGDSWITVTVGSTGSGNGTIFYSVAPNSGSQRSGNITAGGRLFSVTQNGASGIARTNYDFDGDRKADYAVFRASNGYWYILNSSNNSLTARPFGANGDLLAPADFDGDGKTDISVFRPSNGSFYRMNSANDTFTAVTFGTNGDVPVAADYDGDGKGDVAVYRASAGSWYRLNSSNNQFVANPFGSAEDKPIVGDFDGDQKADITVFRPSSGYWYRLNSSNNQFVPSLFGTAEDKPVAADYDGDGRADIAVFRPSNGYWYIINSGNGAFSGTLFGVSQDKPAPADFDGDGKADIAVFRDGVWYVLRSRDGFIGTAFGTTGDKPLSGAYIP